MPARLFWTSENSSSAFKLNNQPLHLTVQDGRLDRISVSPENRDGFSVKEQDGFYTLEAFGECEFQYKNDFFFQRFTRRTTIHIREVL